MQCREELNLKIVKALSKGKRITHSTTIKNGDTIKLEIIRDKPDLDRFPDGQHNEMYLIRACKDNKVLGYAEYYDWGSVEKVFVNRKHRRVGVATAIYNFIEKAGFSLSPTDNWMEQDGKHFWDNRKKHTKESIMPITTNDKQTYIAFIDDKKAIVGYLSHNKLMCTKLENALDITDNPACILKVAQDLLASPHPFDHHGPLQVVVKQGNEIIPSDIFSPKVSTREEHENSPPFSDEYTGPRFKYGFRNRPYGIATCPKGAILMTYKPEEKDQGSRHGTIEYPFRLTKDEVYNYELVDFEQIKENLQQFDKIRISYATALKARGFIIKDSNSELVVAKRTLSVTQDVTDAIRTHLYYTDDAFHVTYSKNDSSRDIKIDAKNIDDLLDSVQRMLKYIDKEINKNKTEEKALEIVKEVTTTPIIPNEPLRFDGHGINDHEGTRIAKLATEPYDYSGDHPKRNPIHDAYGYRLASVNDLHEALKDCVSLLQSPGMKEVIEKLRTIDTTQSTTSRLCKSYLEQSVELRIEQGTKALAAAMPPPEKERQNKKSSGVER